MNELPAAISVAKSSGDLRRQCSESASSQCILLVDPEISADSLHETIYAGGIVILTRLPAVRELVEYAREQLVRLFRPYDPVKVHEHISPAQMAELLGRWKPEFIHAAESKRIVRKIVCEAGLSETDTYFDLPKPRTAFPIGHLTSGIAFAFPWHRDVWYSAPGPQLNWWLPIFRTLPSNSMSFDLASFGRVVPNDSAAFDYYENNMRRLTTSENITHERQVRPRALNHTPQSEFLAIPSPGEVLLFSGAHLHRSIPNTSSEARFSIDFRTVNSVDLAAKRGAPVVDADCTGTAIRDFRRVDDESAFDERLIRRLFGSPPPGALLVTEPSATSS